MRTAGALGLVLATVLGLLALTQFAVIQTSLEAVTTGALNTYVGTFQFFGVLLVVLIAVTSLASVPQEDLDAFAGKTNQELPN